MEEEEEGGDGDGDYERNMVDTLSSSDNEDENISGSGLGGERGSFESEKSILLSNNAYPNFIAPKPLSLEKRKWRSRMKLISVHNDLSSKPSQEIDYPLTTSATTTSKQKFSFPNQSQNLNQSSGLLQSNSGGGQDGSRQRSQDALGVLMREDERALAKAIATPDKHLFIEYMKWMGSGVMEGGEEGEVLCPNCDQSVGQWTWSKEFSTKRRRRSYIEEEMNSASEDVEEDCGVPENLQPPYFRINKEMIVTTLIPLDSSPSTSFEETKEQGRKPSQHQPQTQTSSNHHHHPTSSQSNEDMPRNRGSSADHVRTGVDEGDLDEQRSFFMEDPPITKSAPIGVKESFGFGNDNESNEILEEEEGTNRKKKMQKIMRNEG